MKNLIYFPYFEPKNERWLKYALLYLDSFQPIIPIEKKDKISDTYKKIIYSTDLIKPYSPTSEDILQASTKSIEDIEKFLNHESRYHSLFDTYDLNGLFRGKNTNYLLYQEKFAWEFFDYCRREKIGKFVPNGIELPEKVAYIYMSHLANTISFSTNSHTITDNHKLSSLDRYLNSIEPSENKQFLFVKNTLDIALPVNIDHISFETLIKFRNENRNLIKALNEQLNEMEKQVVTLRPSEFIDKHKESSSEFYAKLGLIGCGLATIPFGIYTTYDSSATTVAYIKDIFAGVSLWNGFKLQFGNISKSNNEKETIKYFANLKHIK